MQKLWTEHGEFFRAGMDGMDGMDIISACYSQANHQHSKKWEYCSVVQRGFMS